MPEFVTRSFRVFRYLVERQLAEQDERQLAPDLVELVFLVEKGPKLAEQEPQLFKKALQWR